MQPNCFMTSALTMIQRIYSGKSPSSRWIEYSDQALLQDGCMPPPNPPPEGWRA